MAGCGWRDLDELGKEEACVAAGTHVVPRNEYDERTGQEALWWELRCDKHLEDFPIVELHEFHAPVVEDDEE